MGTGRARRGIPVSPLSAPHGDTLRDQGFAMLWWPAPAVTRRNGRQYSATGTTMRAKRELLACSSGQYQTLLLIGGDTSRSTGIGQKPLASPAACYRRSPC